MKKMKRKKKASRPTRLSSVSSEQLCMCVCVYVSNEAFIALGTEHKASSSCACHRNRSSQTPLPTAPPLQRPSTQGTGMYLGTRVRTLLAQPLRGPRFKCSRRDLLTRTCDLLGPSSPQGTQGSINRQEPGSELPRLAASQYHPLTFVSTPPLPQA